MFSKVLYQIIIIFSLIGVGVFARFKKFLSEETLKDIINININILLPALTFYTMVTQLTRADLVCCWYLPLVGMLNILLPLLIGVIASTCFDLKSFQKRTFIYLTGFNNYRFLAIPLVYVLFKEKGLALLFFHNLGCTFLYWSLGIWILNEKKEKNAFMHVINPALIGLVLAVIIAMFNVNQYVPKIILDVMHVLGKAAIPISMIAIGGMLSLIKFHKIEKYKPIIALIPLRLIIIPCIMYFILSRLGLSPIGQGLAIVVACMPSASTSPVMVSKYGGDRDMASLVVLVLNICSLLTIPLLLSLFLR